MNPLLTNTGIGDLRFRIVDVTATNQVVANYNPKRIMLGFFNPVAVGTTISPTPMLGLNMGYPPSRFDPKEIMHVDYHGPLLFSEWRSDAFAGPITVAVVEGFSTLLDYTLGKGVDSESRNAAIVGISGDKHKSAANRSKSTENWVDFLRNSRPKLLREFRSDRRR